MTLTRRTTRDLGIVLGLVMALLSVTLAACGSSAPAAPDHGPSVVSAAVRTARTTLGAVGYRVVGSGPPLVMIMGYGGTMEVWDPRFVDDLARHFRVVIFDNAGIGQTQALSAPLTIDAMADQTSALIDALRLGRPDVLGWSMGGMIAQALAVRHPDQVNRLVLCATFPGTGSAVVPSQAAVKALTSSNPGPYLFPTDQGKAWQAFVAATSGYPSSRPASAPVITAQKGAVLEWFAGADPAGPLASTISAPTLIADGTVDRIDAVPNDHALAQLIPGSRLTLYPDAGHAFLFQEERPFAALIESFLSGAPAS
jgi:pimeloyl-ACP methyl ester carboxylesterase